MKLAEIREELKSLFEKGGIERPLYTADLIIASEVGCDRSLFAIQGGREVGDGTAHKIYKKAAERMERVPLSYILGEAEFYGRVFKVGPGVLIPRPETELLVEALLELAPAAAVFADWCTGSGCIAVTLMSENPLLENCLAVDSEEDALKWARKNAELNGLAGKIDFRLNSDPDELKIADSSFDFLVANPPYIPTRELPTLMKDVREYEPRAALDGGPEGDDTALMLLRKLTSKVKPGGFFALETAGRKQIERLKSEAPLSLEIEREICDYNGILRHIIWRKAAI